MKLVSLNTWGGRANKKDVLDFFKRYRNVDIFCLQEVWNGGQHLKNLVTAGVEVKNVMHEFVTDVGEVLYDHVPYFKPHYEGFYGLAVFINKNINVLDEGEVFVYRHKGYIPGPDEDKAHHARNIQWLKVETPNGPKFVINFHGLWVRDGKGDNPERLIQSDKIIDFIRDLKEPKILCGDFNLRPDTQSIKKFEEFGFKNLIRDYGIISTRTSLYTKPEKFADYAFVSGDVQINEFKVLPDEVSDHAALYLEFE